MFLFTLRARLIFLVLLAIVPALGLLLYTGLEERRAAYTEAQARALRTAQRASAQYMREVEGVRQTLTVLARLPQVRGDDPAACSALLADLLKQRQSFANLGVIKPNGDATCSAVPLSSPVNVTDRLYFRRALETHDFSGGDYLVGRVTGKPSVTFAYPILDSARRVQSVVFAALDLAWLDQFVADAQLPAEYTLTLLDGNRAILVQYPDSSGSEGRRVGSVLASPSVSNVNAVTEVVGAQGAPQIVAAVSLDVAPPQGAEAYIVVGVRKDIAYADADQRLARNLLALAAVGLLALGMAWVGGDALVRRRVNALVSAAKRIGAGDLGARAALPHGRDELAQLAGSFNDMALAVQKREADIRKTEARLASIIDIAADAIIAMDEDQRIRLFNKGAEQTYGYTAAEVLGQPVDILLPKRVAETYRQQISDFAAAPQEIRRTRARRELVGLRKDGTEFPAEASMSKVASNGQTIFTLILRDITERKHAEDALRATSERLRALVDASPSAIIAFDLEGKTTAWNPAAERIFGWTAEEVIGRLLPPNIPPDQAEAVRDLRRRALAGEIVPAFEGKRSRKDGSLVDVSVANGPVRDKDGRVVSLVAVMTDISARKHAEARIQQQVERLGALRAIDTAITGGLDLKLNLNVILDQVTTHLRVDAAAVLLFDPHANTLTYAAGRGFRTPAIEQSRLRLGEGAAGRAALERRMVNIADLEQDKDAFVRREVVVSEGFTTYYAAPLIAKGQITGVLEVFHRAPLSPDPNWLTFLETLAGQAAIAVDHITLFNELQRSNAEIAVAYNATLEGWSRALELRDYETAGHSLRVTDMTLRLARALTLPDADLVHIMRGVLLHDIGKMAIPDSTLLKPGSLTEEEWKIVRRHPVYAFELLSPIPYLRPCLDIPYCHHEKWDGSGYPRGLSGQHIPLSARIFSVVDVWDSLRSPRPYKKAWPEPEVRDYLRAQAGKHFDPDAVDAFLSLKPS